MKNKIPLILIPLLLLTMAVSAHGGKTDGTGGHYDNQNKSGLGYYHYHCGGNPPHLHNNGLCPYKSGSYSTEINPKPSSKNNIFDNKQSSGTSVNNFTSDNAAKSSESESSEKNEDSAIGKILGSILGVVFSPLIFIIIIVVSILCGLFSNIYNFFEQYLSGRLINEYKDCFDAFNKQCDKVTRLSGVVKATEAEAVPPAGYEVGPDNLPKEIGCQDWGKSLTVYVKARGWMIHTNKDCVDNLVRRNIYSMRYDLVKRQSVCKMCAHDYIIPDMNWYFAYRRLPHEKEELDRALKKRKSEASALVKSHDACNTRTALFLQKLRKKNRQSLEELNKEFDSCYKFIMIEADRLRICY